MPKTLILAAALFLAPSAHAQSGEGLKLFDKADANRDGIITRAEYGAARMRNFSKLDRDGDGALTDADFKRIARFRPDAAKQLQTMLQRADANGDGRVTRAEFAASPFPIFDRVDANHDGRVDARELAAAKARMAQMRD